jgi:septum formation protein
LVLASASPARLSVLRAGGIEPEVRVSGVDEEAITAPSPSGLVQALAEAKAAVVVRPGVVARAVDAAATVVRFGTPSPDELAAYVATGEPLQVAGAFTIDGRGGWFVEGVDGDHGTVIGLSLPLLRQLLGRVGVGVTDLWAAPPPRDP